MRFIAIFSFLFLLSACGGSDSNVPTSSIYPDAEFIESVSYSFNAEIDPETLAQEQGFSLFSSWEYIRESTYSIISQQDLDAFNQTLSDDEKLILNDLDIYSYFLMRDYSCCDYLEYSYHNYNNGTLTIGMNHFEIPDCGCAAVIVEEWLIFKAEKKDLVGCCNSNSVL